LTALCPIVLISKYKRIVGGGENVARKSYLDYLPEDGRFSEEDLWEAIAESLGVDYSEIADGDLAAFL